MSTTNNIEGNQHNFGDINGGILNFNFSAQRDINLSISIPKKLVARDEMINNIQKEYDGGYDCVVVNGIGGSGKTSLAYLYVKEQDFENVAWITINGKIIDDVLQKMALLLFEGADYNNFVHFDDKDAKLANINRILSSIEGKNLLVLDINTDDENIKQEIENEIHKYLPTSKNWKTLVLTRVLAQNIDWFASIPMETMSEDIAIKLFKKNYQGDVVFTNGQLAEIVNKLYYHPLLIEHTAKIYTDEFGITAEEILNQINKNIVNNERTKKVLSGLAKIGKEKQDIDIYTYLINLCNIEKLSKTEIKFLAVYVTWPEEPIDFDVINTLLPNPNDTLKSLIKKGIIIRNKQFLSIHSLMADVLREQINIKEFDYTEYFDNIQKLLDDDMKKISLHRYSKYIVCSLFNYDICDNIILYRRILLQLLDNGDVILHNLPETKITTIVNKFTGNAEPYQVAHLYNAVARVEDLKGNLSDAKSHYEKAFEIIEGFEENEEIMQLKVWLFNNIASLEHDTDSAKKYYEKALEINRKLPEMPQYLDNLATVLKNIASLENELGDTDSAKKHYEESLKTYRKLPETPQYLYNWATTLRRFAIYEEKLGNTDSAKKHLKESLAIRIKLPETPQFLHMLQVTLYDLATLENKIDILDNDSAKHYKECLSIGMKSFIIPENRNWIIANILGNLNEKELEKELKKEIGECNKPALNEFINEFITNVDTSTLFEAITDLLGSNNYFEKFCNIISRDIWGADMDFNDLISNKKVIVERLKEVGLNNNVALKLLNFKKEDRVYIFEKMHVLKKEDRKDVFKQLVQKIKDEDSIEKIRLFLEEALHQSDGGNNI